MVQLEDEYRYVPETSSRLKKQKEYETNNPPKFFGDRLYAPVHYSKLIQPIAMKEVAKTVQPSFRVEKTISGIPVR